MIRSFFIGRRARRNYVILGLLYFVGFMPWAYITVILSEAVNGWAAVGFFVGILVSAITSFAFFKCYDCMHLMLLNIETTYVMGFRVFLPKRKCYYCKADLGPIFGKLSDV